MDPNAPGSGAPRIPGVEILEVVGRGGFGTVYRGRQEHFGRDVAVKVVSSPGTPDAAVARWRREASAMGRLSDHPNIVAVYAAGLTDDGAPYLVMPYLPGGTLRERIAARGPLAPVDAADTGAKLAGALAAAHATGVLHRDLKPDNVLLSPYGEPQLADFGIARLVDRATTTGNDVLATVPYAAPEILDGQAATARSDVYGLGATLHACLTGQAPFRRGEGDTMVSLMTRVLTQPPPSLEAAGVPPALAATVARAMAKDPADRHPSAEALREDLRAAAARLGASAPAPDGTGAPTAPLPPPSPPTTVLDAPTGTRGAALAGPAAAPEPAPPPEPDDDPAPDPRRRTATAVATVAAVLLLALFALGASRLVGGSDAAAPPETSAPSTSAAPTTEAPTTEAPTTAPPTTPPPTTAPTTTAAPTTTTTAAPTPPAGDLAGAAVTYLQTLAARDFERAWALTTPRFQATQDRDGWMRFWSGFGDIRIVGPVRTDERQGVAVVPLSLDGATEDYRMTLKRQAGGWLVDGPTG